jgi:glucuronokinase
LNYLIDANFDLRAKLYDVGDGNRQMVATARSAGATSKFAGSGGAVVGTYRDDEMYEKLRRALGAIGVAVVKPKIVASRPAATIVK